MTEIAFDGLSLSIGDATDQLFLLALEPASTIALHRPQLRSGTNAEVTCAGAQGTMVGLDQTNLRIPATR